MPKINIKPLSLNHAYRGRRYATDTLTSYKAEILWQLPKYSVPTGKLSARYIFGVSSKGSDVDNLVKCFQDTLAIKYKFNDRKVYEIYIKKVDVKKGEEFVDFELKSLGL